MMRNAQIAAQNNRPNELQDQDEKKEHIEEVHSYQKPFWPQITRNVDTKAR